jgi:hypothetical protein
MAFTRMRRSFKSDVEVRANERAAALVALQTLFIDNPLLPTMDAFSTFEAPSGRSGSAFCTVKSRTFHIDVEDRVLELLSCFAKRGILCYAGIGEHDVELAFLFSNLPENTIKAGKIRYVSLHSADISS